MLTRCIGIIPGVDHARPFDRPLRHAVDDARLRQSGGFQDCGSDVDHVVPLGADLALGFDAVRPVDDHCISRAAVVGRDLLGPGERRIEGDGPTGRHVWIGGRIAPVVVVLQHEVDVRALRFGIEVSHLVIETGHPAFGAGAVVAGDVKDQRVVEFAHVFDRLDDTTRFMIRHVEKGGEDLGLPRVELFLFVGKVGPILDVVRLFRELGVLGDDAQFFLLLKDPLADDVPAFIEIALLLVDIRFRHVMRRMHGTGSKVNKERLVRRECLLETHPLDGLRGHVIHKVVLGIIRRLHAVEVAIDRRCPLIGFTPHEPVELVEPDEVGPARERS